MSNSEMMGDEAKYELKKGNDKTYCILMTKNEIFKNPKMKIHVVAIYIIPIYLLKRNSQGKKKRKKKDNPCSFYG